MIKFNSASFQPIELMKNATGFTNNSIHQNTVIIISLLTTSDWDQSSISILGSEKKILSNKTVYHYSSVNADEKTGG